MPYRDEVVTAYLLIATAEAASNLARFDGVKYGHRGQGQTLDELYTSSRIFGATVRRRLMLGTLPSAGGLPRLLTSRASGCRAIARHLDSLFRQCDVLLLPTAPTVAFTLDGEQDPWPHITMISAIPANLAGLPAVSVPCGLSSGLPVGSSSWPPVQGRLAPARGTYLAVFDGLASALAREVN